MHPKVLMEIIVFVKKTKNSRINYKCFVFNREQSDKKALSKQDNILKMRIALGIYDRLHVQNIEAYFAWRLYSHIMPRGELIYSTVFRIKP